MLGGIVYAWDGSAVGDNEVVAGGEVGDCFVPLALETERQNVLVGKSWLLWQREWADTAIGTGSLARALASAD